MNNPSGTASQAPPKVGANRQVLVLDTDAGVRWALEKGLSASGYHVRLVTNVSDALRVAEHEEFDALLLEYLPEAGLSQDALTMLAEAAGAARIICMSIESDPQTVIECMRRGVTDFVPKPFSMAEIRSALARALASEEEPTAPRKSRSSARPEPTDGSGTHLIGISPAILELRELIGQVATTDLNCLVRGESGTGKDIVAREIHRFSSRSDKAFIKVNCTALPEQLLESELFGYEKGAFTGAITSKPGRFELANNGIIFLDEIGDMHSNLQAKLLQVIEHKEFTKLGGTRAIKVDVQIIAATNADLEERTREGLFRDDLYFRLNEVCIWVPPLSNRKEDVPLLVRHFIQKHSRFNPAASFEISGEDLQQLTNHDWPGNVRELESTIKRWLALGKKVLPGADPPPPIPVTVPPAPIAPQENETETPQDPESEKNRLEQVLEECHWNRRKAAEALGMSYQTLRRRIEKYDLNQVR
jgi:DNA-binding NtrC family response regulator